MDDSRGFPDEWLRHFASFTKPSADDAVLLIVDGHGSHKELAVITYARENHVHMLSIPPHTIHKLQPLDRTFMKLFKNCYNISFSLRMRAPQLLLPI
ncbi:DDE superfamily endonuclease [Popillia japonica]|uniref:DDE superfamily endonuclease n=1 Tax=Popillia japonica TaxID=7064 RepID=A0AAW1LBY4_POPJA